MILDEARKQIQKAIDDRGAFSHNIVGLVLNSVSKTHGLKQANELIRQFDLTEIFGITVKPVVKKYKVTFEQTELKKCYACVEAKDSDEAIDIVRSGYKRRYGKCDYEYPDTTETVVSIIAKEYKVHQLGDDYEI